MTRRTFLAAAAAGALNAAPPRSRMGLATTCYMTFLRPRDTLEFLEHANSLGAGGIQAALGSADPGRLRGRAEQLGMYVEVMGGLPRTDAEVFERSVIAAKAAGALCLRSACLGGRRYETFSTLEEWKKFVADSKAAIARAVPIVEKHRLPLALENHKDWTAGEMAALMKEYSSEYLGVCLDTGNNISLLDDPMDVVERLAPWTISTHIKDMAVEEYPRGFLLSEMPLGDGMLDIKRIIETIRRARPSTRMTLEMITRDPLEIPCLTDKYWSTFPERSGRYLSRTLAMVRSHEPAYPLPRFQQLDRGAQLRAEEDNVKRCLNYARERLGV